MDGPDLAIGYDALSQSGEWLMATGAERALIERLTATCRRLDDPSLTKAIIVGIQTSADAIYHLERLTKGRYRCKPKGASAYEVEIEDAIMKPLVSGAEAKRYEAPQTDIYLLFPYERTEGGAMRLRSPGELERQFPKAWSYLLSWELDLRARENQRMNNASWYGYNYPKNLDKQEINKLIVAQTTPEMRVCADTTGDRYLNNVRVNGILPSRGVDQFYLLGVLNGPVADFVFRRIGKVKAGGYFEANKQFIAPLPIPNATPQGREAVAALARELQRLWTERRELVEAASARLSVLPQARHGEHWLWPELPSLGDLEVGAPSSLSTPRLRRDWAVERLEAAVDEETEALVARLAAAAQVDAVFSDGELSLLADGAAILNRLFLAEADGRMIQAYWRWLLLNRTGTGADKLAADLRRPPADPASPAAAQFIAKVDDLARVTGEIVAAEGVMNDHLFDLYGLTDQERALVEEDSGRRVGRANQP